MQKIAKFLAGLGLLLLAVGGLATFIPPSWDPSGIIGSIGFLTFMTGFFALAFAFLAGFGQSTHG